MSLYRSKFEREYLCDFSPSCGTQVSNAHRTPFRITIAPMTIDEKVYFSDSAPTVRVDNGRVFEFTDADTGNRIELNISVDREFTIEQDVLSPANERKIADAATLKELRQQAQVKLLAQVAARIGVPLWKLHNIGVAGIAQLVNLLTDKGLPSATDVSALFVRSEFVEPPAGIAEITTVFGQIDAPGVKTLLDGENVVSSNDTKQVTEPSVLPE